MSRDFALGMVRDRLLRTGARSAAVVCCRAEPFDAIAPASRSGNRTTRGRTRSARSSPMAP